MGYGSGNFTDTITGLRKFDGRRSGDFRGWYKKLAVVLGVARRDIGSLIKGKTRPAKNSVGTGISHTRPFTLGAQATLDQDITGYDGANEDLYAVLFLLTEAPASLLVLKHEDETGISGNGQKALQELVAKYNKVTGEVIRATMERLVNSSMEPGQDPDHYFMEKILVRSELEEMGEHISDRRFKDICVQGFTAEYKDIKLMMYRDPTFEIDQMQTTMRHLYLDDLSRSDRAKGATTDRGIAMTAETSTCYDCRKQGHYARNCPKNKNKNYSWKARAKGVAGQKWCSVHKITSHNDEDCYEQGTPRPPKEPVAGNGAGDLQPNGDRFTMLVDSGASDHLVDDELIPRLRHSMKHYKKLKKPKAIVTAANERVFATATGTIWGRIIDQAGQPVPVRISAMIVPGLGRNLFSPIKALTSGVSTILETGNPHLRFDSNTSLPLNQHPEDKGLCSYEVSLHALGDTIETPSTPAVALAAHASNNTPEEATVAETKRQRVKIQESTPEEDTVAEAERQRAQVQDRLHENASILQEENKSPTTAGASPTGAEVSSPGRGTSWTGARASSPGAVATSSGVSTATSPGVAPSTSSGVTQGLLHLVTASAGSGTFAEGTFEVAYGKLPPAQLLIDRAPPEKPPDKRAGISNADRGPCRVSEEDNKVIKNPQWNHWIAIAPQSNRIRDRWINFILDYRSISWIDSITWDHWTRWIVAIWDHRTIS